ncbi:Glutamate racemase [bioreactor metagenome]|uniref:Glutamate racemase n=1 Tax=bioreactor metagenome TaxID=1076179 RepID=A0A644Y4Z6_9ZZZZ
MGTKIGIIADTATDTAMGRDYFESKGYEVVMRPLKETSPECGRFFQEPPEERAAYVSALIDEVKADGARIVMIYANSLCAYVDVDRLCAENGIGVVTPFHAYQKLGKAFKKPCVWAATGGALSGIEKRLTDSNFNIEICGVSLLPVVEQIEAGLAPAQIVAQSGLKELIHFSEKAGCDSIILGCTHFPSLMQELLPLAGIPVIDPANTMLEMLRESIAKQ